MRLEVEIVDYTGEERVKEKHILPLAEAIALKAEVDQQENKAAYLSLPNEDISGYLFNLGEGINVLVNSQQVGEKRFYKPVVKASLEELEAALVYSVVGRFDSQDEEKWEIESKNFLSIKLPQGDIPRAERYRGSFRLISRFPIPDSEVEAAKAEVERLWSFAANKTQACREIFQKLSLEEQEFLRKNLRSGIAPED